MLDAIGPSGPVAAFARDRDVTQSPAWPIFVPVLAAVLFNMALCFVDTRGVRISLTEVAAVEAMIIAGTVALAWRTLLSSALLPALLVVGWFSVVRLINGAASPKILLDLAIPAAFFAIGHAYGTRRIGDRLVLVLACLVLAVGLFEWFAFDIYQRQFDIFQYYLGKGDLKPTQAGDTGTTLGENGMRPGERQLLPFLGLHRMGSVFLEPIAVGNFATILVAWVMTRARLDRTAAFLVVIAAVLAVLADDRFAVLAGVSIVLAVASGAWRWRLIGALIPFAVVLLLLVFAAVSPERVVDNSIGGRLYGSGSFLLAQGPVEWLALTPTRIDMDSGYSTFIDAIGVVAPAALWLRFAITRPASDDAARLTLAMSVYFSLSLCISGSSTSIKTAALLWCLRGITGRGTT